MPLEILQDLHLDPRAAQLLGKSFDLLVMLVVASQTHVHTKVGRQDDGFSDPFVQD